jgi:hypothetical protein
VPSNQPNPIQPGLIPNRDGPKIVFRVLNSKRA